MTMIRRRTIGLQGFEAPTGRHRRKRGAEAELVVGSLPPLGHQRRGLRSLTRGSARAEEPLGTRWTADLRIMRP